MGAPCERPKRGFYYGSVIQDLKFLRDLPDPQRDAVYRWEHAVLADLPREDVLGAVNFGVRMREARAASVKYIEHLWQRHAANFKPYWPGAPYLRIGNDCVRLPPRRRVATRAHAQISAHSIYCRLSGLYRSTILHEVCHLLTWRDHHGPEFCAGLVHLWAHEFHIERSYALKLAVEHGVQIA